MTKIRHANSVDVLKTLAVVLVVLYHADINFFKNGFWGVDIFLVVTGFLSAKTLNNATVMEFLVGRFLRIYPGLIFYLICVLFIVLPIGFYAEVRELAKYEVSSILLATNIAMLATDGYFTQQTHLPLFHLWSISLEFQCWVILSVVCLFHNQLRNLTIISLLSLILFFYKFDPMKLDLVYLLPQTRFWAVGIGFLAYQMRGRVIGLLSSSVIFYALLLMLLLIITFAPITSYTWLSITLISAIIIMNPINLQNSFYSIYYYFSINTYGIYLWHILILFILNEVNTPLLFNQILVLPLTFLLANLLRNKLG